MNKKSVYWILPVRCLVFPLCFMAISILSGESLENLSKWWAVIAIVINIACILLICAVNKGNYKDFINYEKDKTKVGLVVTIVVFTIISGVGGMYAAGFLCYGEFPYLDATMVQPLPIMAAIICVALLPLTSTLAEDGIYLGVINKSDGSMKITLISAFFYAAQHSAIPLLPDGRFMFYRFLCFLPLALLFCFWYRKIKNPLPFMIGHFIMNLFTVAMLIVTAIVPDLFEIAK